MEISCVHRLVSGFKLYIYFSNASGAETSLHMYNAALNKVLHCMTLEVFFILISYSLASAAASAILKAFCSFYTISLS